MKTYKTYSKIAKNDIKRGLVILILLLCASFLILPLLYVVFASFMSEQELAFYYFDPNGVKGLRTSVDYFTLSQYRSALLENTDFTRAMLNSLGLATASTLLSMLLVIPAAYALAHSPLKKKKALFFICLCAALVPYHAIGLPQRFLFEKTHLLGTDIAVVLANSFDPTELLFLTVFFASILNEQLEAAYVDGANVIRTFLSVALPQVRPLVSIVFLLKFVNVWNMIEQPL